MDASRRMPGHRAWNAVFRANSNSTPIAIGFFGNVETYKLIFEYWMSELALVWRHAEYKHIRRALQESRKQFTVSCSLYAMRCGAIGKSDRIVWRWLSVVYIFMRLFRVGATNSPIVYNSKLMDEWGIKEMIEEWLSRIETVFCWCSQFINFTVNISGSQSGSRSAST